MTGCLLCKKIHLRCDELKPVCGRCQRLELRCTWAESATQVQLVARQPHLERVESANRIAMIASHGLIGPPTFEFPMVERASHLYIKHFIDFCSRFLAYVNDGQSNPFRKELVPLTASSPALLHSMIALAAGHMARGDSRHLLPAVKHYSMALQELNRALSDPGQLTLTSTLGACLLLCVYEVSIPPIGSNSPTQTPTDNPLGVRSVVAALARCSGPHHVSWRSTNIRLPLPVLLIARYIWIFIVWQRSTDSRKLLAQCRSACERCA
jgi:hypothetical protein